VERKDALPARLFGARKIPDRTIAMRNQIVRNDCQSTAANLSLSLNPDAEPMKSKQDSHTYAHSHHVPAFNQPLHVGRPNVGNRERFFERMNDQILQAENVLARRYFYPGCHRMEPYRSYFPHAGRFLPETEKLAQRVLLLPTGTAMDEKTIEIICSIIRSALEAQERNAGTTILTV
jgi:hypothetical protein